MLEFLFPVPPLHHRRRLVVWHACPVAVRVPALEGEGQWEQGVKSGCVCVCVCVCVWGVCVCDEGRGQ